MNQQGNVLFMVLIAIALFGALTVNVMRSENVAGSIHNESLSIQLYQLTDYASQIEQAVTDLMVQRGCALTELSFDHADRANYNTAEHYLNANSPSGNVCDIFATAGAGVPYKEPLAMVAEAGTSEYGITGIMAIEGLGRNPDDVGDAGAELVFINRLPRAACLRVNREMDIANPSGEPPEVANADAAFPAVLGTSESFPIAAGSEGMDWSFTIGVTGQAPALHMKKSGCYQSTSNDHYYFYYVLLTR